MANEIRQLPARLNLFFNIRNSLLLTLDFNIDLSSYTFESKLYNEDKSINESLTVTVINLSLGQLTVALTKAQVESVLLNEDDIFEWYFDIITITTRRTVLAGNVTIYEGI